MASSKNGEKNLPVFEWIYDKEILSSSEIVKHYSKCYEKISSIIKREKFKNLIPFEEQLALNLDKVEGLRAKQEKRQEKHKTVDFVIGIKSRKSKCKQIRLVECKFEVKANNKSLIDDLKGKLHETVLFYSFDYPFCPFFIVLLNNNHYQQGLRYIKNQFCNAPWVEVLNVDGFYEKYFV